MNDIMKSPWSKMLITLEHKYGEESHEAITFKLMYISYNMHHGTGKITRSRLEEYWKNKIGG